MFVLFILQLNLLLDSLDELKNNKYGQFGKIHDSDSTLSLLRLHYMANSVSFDEFCGI